jgi:hypothetical protein
MATPIPTPIFVLASDDSGRERFRAELDLSRDGLFSTASAWDMCDLLDSDKELQTESWHVDEDRLWLQNIYDLRFYVGNAKYEPPPQAFAVFEERRVEITPTLRLRPPPDGWPESYRPGDSFQVNAYLACGSKHISVQDSLIAPRLVAVVLLRTAGSVQVDRIPLSPSVGRRQDFIGRISVPANAGEYSMTVAVRLTGGQTDLVISQPIVLAVVPSSQNTGSAIKNPNSSSGRWELTSKH